MKEEYVGWLDGEWNVVLDHDQPIVRCRDCKRWAADDCEWNRFFNDPDLDEPDGFCAWGERRGDA